MKLHPTIMLLAVAACATEPPVELEQQKASVNAFFEVAPTDGWSRNFNLAYTDPTPGQVCGGNFSLDVRVDVGRVTWDSVHVRRIAFTVNRPGARIWIESAWIGPSGAFQPLSLQDVIERFGPGGPPHGFTKEWSIEQTFPIQRTFPTYFVISFADSAGADIACGGEHRVVMIPGNVAAPPTESCVADRVEIPNNPLGTNVLCGGFARTWKYFATAGSPWAYAPGAHFNRGLKLLGWPIRDVESRTVEGKPDRIQRTERMVSNLHGGCPYGACLARMGAATLHNEGTPVAGGILGIHQCWEDSTKARPFECIADYGVIYPELKSIVAELGPLGLEYYGFPLHPPRDCFWWDRSWGPKRKCVTFERAKLGLFENHSPEFRWLGEALGWKHDSLSWLP